MFGIASLPTCVKCLTKQYTKDVIVCETNTFKNEKEVQKIEVKKKMVVKQVSRLLKCHSQDEKHHIDVATVKRKDIRFI